MTDKRPKFRATVPRLPVSDVTATLEFYVGSMNRAFLVASINGQTEVVEYLLDKGMDVNMQPPGSDFAGIGGTALHWAARFGHRKTVELLVARGANLPARDDLFQLTPAGLMMDSKGVVEAVQNASIPKVEVE